jgi:hypothetical protein
MVTLFLTLLVLLLVQFLQSLALKFFLSPRLFDPLAVGIHAPVHVRFDSTFHDTPFPLPGIRRFARQRTRSARERNRYSVLGGIGRASTGPFGVIAAPCRCKV